MARAYKILGQQSSTANIRSGGFGIAILTWT